MSRFFSHHRTHGPRPSRPRRAACALLLLAFSAGPLALASVASAQSIPAELYVDPTLYTSQVHTDADDCAIWINPIDSSQSRIIGTDKGVTDGGLFVWDLDGVETQYFPFSKPNNVDLRRDALIGGEFMDLAVANVRNGNALKVYRVDAGGSLSEVTTAGGIHIPDFDPLGICLYRRPTDGVVFVIQTATDSAYQNLRQWRLEADGQGGVQATFVRAFGGSYVASPAEGVVADDDLGYVYVAEQSLGIHKFYADPDSSNDRLALFATGDDIHGDREGLAIYACADGTGYILLSSQGNSTVKVYPREGSPTNPHQHDLVTTIVTSGSASTDGLDVTNLPAGSTFPGGLLVKHDGSAKRFALYSWEAVAQGYLTVCPGTPLSRVDDRTVPTALGANRPNPFSTETVFSYQLARAQEVLVSVYDLSGARVATLQQGRRDAGTHRVVFRPRRLPSGMYFVVLEAAGLRQVRRVVLAR